MHGRGVGDIEIGGNATETAAVIEAVFGLIVVDDEIDRG